MPLVWSELLVVSQDGLQLLPAEPLSSSSDPRSFPLEVDWLAVKPLSLPSVPSSSPVEPWSPVDPTMHALVPSWPIMSSR